MDRVHVDGLDRTKDDVIKQTVDELFHAADFEDVILRAHKVPPPLLYFTGHTCTRTLFMHVIIASQFALDYLGILII